MKEVLNVRHPYLYVSKESTSKVIIAQQKAYFFLHLWGIVDTSESPASCSFVILVPEHN